MQDCIDAERGSTRQCRRPERPDTARGGDRTQRNRRRACTLNRPGIPWSPSRSVATVVLEATGRVHGGRLPEADAPAAAQDQFLPQQQLLGLANDRAIRAVRADVDQHEFPAPALDARMEPRGHPIRDDQVARGIAPDDKHR